MRGAIAWSIQTENTSCGLENLSPRPKWAFPLGLAILWAALFLIYGQTLQHEAIAYDDFDYLPADHGETGLFDGIFSTPVANLWHPLTVFSHRIAQRFFGDAYGLHHLVNLLLHGAGASCLYLWIARGCQRYLVAFFCAVLWAVHPVMVEPVAWLSGRKDVLLGACLFGGLAASTWKGGRSLALVLFLCAYLTKPLAVVLPALFLISTIWPGWGENERKWTMRTFVTLVCGSLALAAITFSFQALGGQGNSVMPPLSERLAGAAWSVGESLRHIIFPLQLHLGYENPTRLSFPLLATLTAIFATGILLAWRARKRCPTLLAGIAWFLIPLLPTAGLVRAGNSLVADRYLYLPLLGLLLIVVPPLLARPAFRKISVIILSALALTLGCLSHRQAATWRNTETVFHHILSIDPGHALAHSKLGERLVLAGGDPALARDHLNRALARRPEDPGAHLHLGILDSRAGRFAEAAQHYETTLRYWPPLPWIRSNLAGCQWASGAQSEAWKTLDETPPPEEQPLWLHEERARLLATGSNDPNFLQEALSDLDTLHREHPNLRQEIENLRLSLASY